MDMTENWRVHVDHDLCIGSGLCLATASGYFELNRDGLAQPLRSTVQRADALAAAAELCPASAIFLDTPESSDAEEHDGQPAA
jgi:ferredoxin